MYRLTGSVRGVPVNVTWDVYRDALVSDTTVSAGDGFCAFVDGQWVGGAVHTSANGTFAGTTWMGTMFGPTAAPIPKPTYLLSGTRAAQGVAFPVTVSPAGAPETVDTLTALQVSGPS